MPRKKTPVIDLAKQDSCGRVDVLAARLLDEFAEHVVEVRPIIDEQREVIHARLNELAGPHVVDLSDVAKTVRPYLPLIGGLASRALSEYRKSREQTKPDGGNQAA